MIDQCLWKYYLKYCLKIPGFGSSNEEALNFGSFIHKIFELGYKDNDPKLLAKLAESERGSYKIPFGMNDRLKMCIENFVIWNSKIGETVSTEGMFEVTLDKEHDIKFNGVIDRIVKGNKGGYLVVDYKTSKREKTKKELMDDKQLMGYAYAVHEKYGVEFKDIFCAHYYPVTGNFITVNFSKVQIWNWKRKEIDKVWRIRKKTKDEFYPQKNIFCSNCEFQQACENYNSPEVVKCKIEEQLELKKKKDLAKKLAEVVPVNTEDNKAAKPQ